MTRGLGIGTSSACVSGDIFPGLGRPRRDVYYQLNEKRDDGGRGFDTDWLSPIYVARTKPDARVVVTTGRCDI